MAYIGTIPAEAYTSFAVQHFTTSATDTFTLDFPVANENEIALFINNVRQEPGSSYAYTASGTTLTLSSAITGSDSMYCVFIGKAVQTVTPASGSVTNDMLAGSIANAKLANSSITLNGSAVSLGGSATTATTNGITEMDSWRITADVTGNTVPLTSNWERVDTYDWTKFGTGLSESSGVFSFPSNGYWLLLARQQIANAVTSNFQCGLRLEWTNDNFSSANYPMEPPSNVVSGYVQSHTMAYVFDVTNTTNNKFRFSFTTSDANGVLKGNTSLTTTGFTIMRIGDT